MRLSSEEFGAAPVSVMTLNRYGWALIRRKYDAPLLEERVLRCAAPPDDRWTHVLVDEFQDISPLDLRLVKAIAERSGAALTIVGDDDQAIYEWRGGAPTYSLNRRGSSAASSRRLCWSGTTVVRATWWRQTQTSGSTLRTI